MPSLACLAALPARPVATSALPSVHARRSEHARGLLALRWRVPCGGGASARGVQASELRTKWVGGGVQPVYRGRATDKAMPPSTADRLCPETRLDVDGDMLRGQGVGESVDRT